jgi:phosphoribosyl 1,2-cyclic phosphate phosphodiesterase
MDHFFPAELALHKHPFLLSPIETIHVYGNKAVEARLKDASEKEGTPPNNEFHFIPPFEPVEVEGYRITSFLALHDRKEECRFYAADHNGITLLYAHDTGIFPQPVWDYFTKTNMHFDLVSLDCTMVKEKEGTNHMGLPDNIEVRDRLISMGAADKNTRFVVNHFSHGGGLNHKALARAAKKEGFIAAYDGMEIEV